MLPQITSGIRAAGITDPGLRQLYSAIYRAFRRRRSLLLLNLESQVKTHHWHDRLIIMKNTAYAWRQMVFFLALPPDTRVHSFLSWADEHLGKQKEEFQTRFRPALQGLVSAAEGRSPDHKSVSRLGARLFLGWSKKKHWLLS